MKPGDRVRATKTITRVDNRCCLREGGKATILSSWPGEKYEIVSIRLDDGGQMISICVKDGIPLVPYADYPEST